jgi:hypothetical protein
MLKRPARCHARFTAIHSEIPWENIVGMRRTRQRPSADHGADVMKC